MYPKRLETILVGEKKTNFKYRGDVWLIFSHASAQTDELN